LTCLTSIVDQIKELIKQFPSLTEALEELPYPRASLLTHLFNTTIYSLIFSRVAISDQMDEIAMASIFHDIGLSESHFKTIFHNRRNLKKRDMFLLEAHIEKTIEILEKKYVPITKVMKEVILTHHENYDGTGFPHGLSIQQLKPHQLILPMADLLDRIRIVSSGEKERTFEDSFERLKAYSKRSALGAKVDIRLFDTIDNYLKSLNAKI
jgi:response regulator RpfG family c-di-GMP phosphodiesterase